MYVCGIQKKRHTASVRSTYSSIFSRTYFLLYSQILGLAEMLRYERTPHVNAPKVFAMDGGKSIKLVLCHTFRKARWMYRYNKSQE